MEVPTAGVIVGRLSETSLVESNDVPFEVGLDVLDGVSPGVGAGGVTVDEEEGGLLAQVLSVAL